MLPIDVGCHRWQFEFCVQGTFRFVPLARFFPFLSFFFFFCPVVSWRLPDTEERPTGHRKRGHREKSGGRETSARRSSTVGFFSVPWFNGNVVDNDYGVSRSRSRPLKRKPFAGNPVRRIRAGSIFQIEIISLGLD